MELTQLEDAFVDIGGHFLKSAFDLREKMSSIKAVVFDWDGVFNNGEIDAEESNTYSLIDAQGIDSLRFGFFKAHSRMLLTAVISEVKNDGCKAWANRYNADEVYLNAMDKKKALLHFCDKHNLKPEEVIFVYDDVKDLAAAAVAGIKLAVGRLGTPLLIEYIEQKKLADYISSCQGNEHAVREFSELLLALLDQHFNVLDHAESHTADYADYLNRRKSIDTEVHLAV